MTRLFAHIILILVVAFSQLYNSIVTAVYEANYDYYATELCENKDKPQLHCNGKCYFAKQLALADDSPNKTEPPQLLPTLRLFSPAQFQFTVAVLPTVGSNLIPVRFVSFPSTPFLEQVDHPPQV